MNKLTLEKIATSLLKACKDEGVMYKEAAKIFNTEPAYFKMLEREDKREAIPEKVMDRFHAWVYSGKKLKEYKIPDAVFPLEVLDEILNNSGATIIESPEEPVIKIKPEALAKRKKELAERKPKRKYTKKAKENPPEVTEKILADAPVPADKHYAEAVPDVRPDVRLDVPDIQIIPIEKAERVIKEWLRICPARLMIPKDDIAIIANSVGVDRLFAKEVIIREIANDDLTRTCKHPYFTRKSEESETDLLKSEIKTLAALLTREYEAAEVLRAENGYLNLLVKYKERMIGVLESNAKSSSIMINDMSQRVVKLKYRGFWARVFNRPVK